ncbi:hypothetical protein [Rhodohalobacter sulfatireducens]|uniref:Secreted protein n=1 Tax=Rhodohalobacter sulfatireducens TaxID=2911366 RepID=A0ABS9KI80_9BACT|nr:hypothetical protein [Rhodohalobacter sulfatireducens]MCG2590562.1 hypothetical protein [Rhodohalobacter sulfatireducens]
MKKCILIILFLFTSSALLALNVNDQKEDAYPRKNSFYTQNFIIFPTANFDRILPVNDKVGFISKIGFGFYDTIVPILEASFFAHKKKSYGEFGLGYWGFAGAVINVNYRFMGRKGFLLKGGFSFVPGEEGFPLLGLGYSF